MLMSHGKTGLHHSSHDSTKFKCCRDSTSFKCCRVLLKGVPARTTTHHPSCRLRCIQFGTEFSFFTRTRGGVMGQIDVKDTSECNTASDHTSEGNNPKCDNATRLATCNTQSEAKGDWHRRGYCLVDSHHAKPQGRQSSRKPLQS